MVKDESGSAQVAGLGERWVVKRGDGGCAFLAAPFCCAPDDLGWRFGPWGERRQAYLFRERSVADAAAEFARRAGNTRVEVVEAGADPDAAPVAPIAVAFDWARGIKGDHLLTLPDGRVVEADRRRLDAVAFDEIQRRSAEAAERNAAFVKGGEP